MKSPNGIRRLRDAWRATRSPSDDFVIGVGLGAVACAWVIEIAWGLPL